MSEHLFCLSCAGTQVHMCVDAGDAIHSPTNLRVAVKRRDIVQYGNKDREEDCKLINMDVSNAGFEILTISALQFLFEDGHALCTRVCYFVGVGKKSQQSPF